MKEKIKEFDYKIIIYLFLTLSISFCIIKQNNPELDSFYMAATGRYIVDNQCIPQTNVFLLDKDLSLTVQQWLFCILCYEVYGHIGIIGSFIYSYGIFIVNLCLLFHLLQKRNNKPNENLFAIASFSVLLAKFINFRPQTLDLVVLLILIDTLYEFRLHQNKIRLYIVLPLLSLFTINVHASYWIFNFIFILPFIFIEHFPFDIKSYFKRNYPIFISMIFMVFISFLNPCGYKNMLYFKYLFVEEIKILVGELQPAYKSYMFAFWVITVISFIVYMKKKEIQTVFSGQPRLSLLNEAPFIYLCLGTIILSFLCIKNLWFLILTGPFLLSDIIQHKKKNDTFSKIYYMVLAAFTIIVFYLWSVIPTKYMDSSSFPLSAMNYIKENDIHADRIYSEYDMGSYLEWLGYQAYIDTRAEMSFKKANGRKDLFHEYIDLRTGDLNISEFIDKYGFDYFICYPNTPLTSYLENNNYPLILETSSYKFYKTK